MTEELTRTVEYGALKLTKFSDMTAIGIGSKLEMVDMLISVGLTKKEDTIGFIVRKREGDTDPYYFEIVKRAGVEEEGGEVAVLSTLHATAGNQYGPYEANDLANECELFIAMINQDIEPKGTL